MRNTILPMFFFVALLPVSCTMPEPKDEKIVDEPLPQRKDGFHQLCQYWEVTDAERPTFRDLYDNQQDKVYNYPGIVFMSDSTFLENPRAEMRYGKFSFKGKQLEAKFDDGKNAVYTIQDKRGNTMVVKRTDKNEATILYLKASNVFWPAADKNPYNKLYSQWRMKPKAAEDDMQLKERLKGCVRFYEYFFKGYAESAADEIDFLGLPTCFKWYQGGIFVQSAKTLDKKWINCFYSEEQALHARQVMEDALSKKYDWDTTERNWIKQIPPVLKQIYGK
ncbi:MAG: hypothetical protein ABJA90_07560, partial [Ginsengibacter sp.]